MAFWLLCYCELNTLKNTIVFRPNFDVSINLKCIDVELEYGYISYTYDYKHVYLKTFNTELD